jgi:thioredoxin reductase (NADPH)
MRDIMIIGKGPAGISAALYAKRAGVDVAVIGKDHGALIKAEKIENYFGCAEAHAGQELVEAGWKQASNLDIDVITDEVVNLDWNEHFIIGTPESSYEAKAVILATGASRKTPNIPGIKEFEGCGVSYCAMCDAFFYRGKAVAVLGNGLYASHEARELLPVAGSVTLLTNGLPLADEFPKEVKIIDTPVDRLEGSDRLERIHFKDGSSEAFNGVFIAMGTASASELARKLGAEMNGVNVAVNDNMETSIPGLYAAGDCTGGMYQISKAVAQGAQAAVSAISFVRKAKANKQ